MKVEVWTKRHFSEGIEAKCIWRGDMHAVPRYGEFICLNGDWCSERVEEVHYNLEEGSVLLEIHPDYHNEYPDVGEG